MPFYSGGLGMQSAFLAAPLLCSEHIMQLSSWPRSSLWWKLPPPPDWGFWAQTFPCVVSAAFYNKPSPTPIHIFIILFLEMQFGEGKCDLTALRVVDPSVWVSLGSGCKHNNCNTRFGRARLPPHLAIFQATRSFVKTHRAGWPFPIAALSVWFRLWV